MLFLIGIGYGLDDLEKKPMFDHKKWIISS